MHKHTQRDTTSRTVGNISDKRQALHKTFLPPVLARCQLSLSLSLSAALSHSLCCRMQRLLINVCLCDCNTISITCVNIYCLPVPPRGRKRLSAAGTGDKGRKDILFLPPPPSPWSHLAHVSQKSISTCPSLSLSVSRSM